MLTGPRRGSINRRLLLSSSALLLLFLGGMAVGLLSAYAHGSRAALYERLRTEIYALLSALEVDDSGRLMMPDTLPQPRLQTPGSGLYAQIEAAPGARWRSPSATGVAPLFPVAGEPGRFVTAELESASGGFFGVALRVEWELRDATLPVVLRVAEEATALDEQIGGFRRTLLAWLVSLGLLLLAVQAALLRWGLAPLGRAAGELEAVTRGGRQRLAADYPRELAPLTETVNRFIERQGERGERYRAALADLAHSLKTPLAVIRNALQAQAAPPAQDLLPEVRRMEAIIARELARAAARGPDPLGRSVPLAGVLDRLLASLAKVHADKRVQVERRLPDGLSFGGDETDLMEMLGNLLDNAFAWCRARVCVGARERTVPGKGRRLEIEIADDGAGIDPALSSDEVFERGVSTRDGGSGLGLAQVREIARACGGAVTIRRGAAGGTCVTLELPAGSAAQDGAL